MPDQPVTPIVATRVTTSDDTAPGAEHTCERPSWSCRVCGQPWPCVTARVSLAAGGDLVMLTMYMWGHLDRAVADLPSEEPADLFERFLGWAGSPPVRTGP